MSGRVEVNPRDGAEMCWIEEGEFLMGSRYEQPAHVVFTDGFWMYRRQVTNRQYSHFCDITGYSPPTDPLSGYLETSPGHPVVNVTWHDAAAYCAWAGGRLPTEAEWEKAARGGPVGAVYPWGNDEPDEGEFANFKDYTGRLSGRRIPFDARGRGPLPCGSFPANDFGLFDMAGNAWDWVADWYDPDYYHVSPRMNPIGPVSGTTRVRRGGCWARSSLSMRSACRSSMPPESRDPRMGFRVLIPKVVVHDGRGE